MLAILVTFITKNLYLTFLLNISGIYGVISWFFKIVINTHSNITLNGTIEKKIMTIPFPLNINDYMLFITTIIMYFILKAYFKIKTKTASLIDEINIAKKQIDDSNTHWFNQMQNLGREFTNNLNDSHQTLSLVIQYNNFLQNNKNLQPDDFINALNKEGFSLEDLEELGVNKETINLHREKLYPKAVMEKYKDFKFELIKYKNQNDNTRNLH